MDVPTYDLPDSAIAQTPAEPRDAARLLVAGGGADPAATARHRRVADLPDELAAGDVLVVNTSRVLPARLRLRKATGGAAEVLLLEPEPTAGGPPGGSPASPGGEPLRWRALVQPGRRLAPGTPLFAGGRAPVAEVGERLADGMRAVRLLPAPGQTLEALLAGIGTVPLPPYIHTALADPERYQTVYAERPGSVAAPTAGLHLTDEVLARCRDRGVAVASVDLAVGLGTFRPVTAERVEDHEMHEERYHVPEATLAACAAAQRVVAVGTTVVRALETAAATGRTSGRSDLFIRPGHTWRAVDALLTNFHQPRSTLLLLVEAFVGPRWRDLYALALAEGYRFLSFGDAMLLTGGRSSGGGR
ncbi:MAG TPA: tRNA preQ1(34) S-adenosylmethionine ribosyltransferase-isomerase QueA [Acidimicrobiales bacterium]|nr:tRNA preQ1(34) S-adenosylmethionine ribosyltransferase-isomerase QueA [Acidimicrobiales bacterium]